jgi:NAD(P)-dependent dehydrogenase (short-subunit alcohol dehydrogenase family)
MKTAIVTGASGNLGQAVVKKFLSENYFVHGTVIPNDPVPLDIPDKNFTRSVVDLLNEAETADYIESLGKDGKTIDAGIFTVGGFAMGDIARTGSGDILKQYRLNFETAYHISRPVFKQMLKKGSGKLFFIGASPGLDMRYAKGMTAYGLSKSLVFRLAELLNEEAKGTGIVAHMVVPSTLDTMQNRKSMPDADFSKWVKPEAIAEIIYFHCTDMASVIREPVIKVYGNS